MKELGANYIVAKASNDKHKRVLEKIGADYVIVPEAEMAHKLANRLMNKRLNDLMEVNDKYSIVESPCRRLVRESLIELGVRKPLPRQRDTRACRRRGRNLVTWWRYRPWRLRPHACGR